MTGSLQRASIKAGVTCPQVRQPLQNQQWEIAHVVAAAMYHGMAMHRTSTAILTSKQTPAYTMACQTILAKKMPLEAIQTRIHLIYILDVAVFRISMILLIPGRCIVTVVPLVTLVRHTRLYQPVSHQLPLYQHQLHRLRCQRPCFLLYRHLLNQLRSHRMRQLSKCKPQSRPQLQSLR